MKIENFNNDGYIILDDILSEESFNKIKIYSEYYIQRCLKRQNNTGNIGYNIFRTENLAYDFPFDEIFNEDELHLFLKKVLGEDFILQEILIHFSLPENHIQELHSDVNNLFNKAGFSTPSFLVAVHFPLVNFNYKSGGTRIIKNTHNKVDSAPPLLEEENIQEIYKYTPNVEIKSCLVRDCRAWHGAGLNQTKEIRAMISLAFSKKWYGSPAKVSKDLYYSINREYRHMFDI